MTDNLPEAAHSDVMGGSTAAQRIYCPGSYLLEKPLPATPESDYAKEGTALHSCIEYALPLDREIDLYEALVGEEFNGVEITAEHIENKIIPALEAFDEICDQHGGCDEYMLEVKGSLDPMVPGAFGTVDLLARMSDGVVLNLDWKFGDGVPVSVKANMQLGFYAGCALYNQDEAVEALVYGKEDGVDTVGPVNFEFAIVQPRRGHGGPCYDTWATTSDWVEDFIDLAAEAYEKAMKPNAPIKTGSHCRWCDAKAVCPALTKVVGEALTQAPETMDAISFSAALKKADEVEAWLKEVRKRAHSELEAGADIPGYKLVNKRASRVYNDKEKAARALTRILKTAEAHKPREVISPAQAEKKLGKKIYTKIMSKYVSYVSSGNTLVPDTDKREAVNTVLDITDETTKNVFTKKSSLFISKN